MRSENSHHGLVASSNHDSDPAMAEGIVHKGVGQCHQKVLFNTMFWPSSDVGSVVEDARSMVKDVGSIVEDVGSAVEDVGSIVEDVGSIVKDVGSIAEDVGSAVEDVGSIVEDVGSIGEWSIVEDVRISAETMCVQK